MPKHELAPDSATMEWLFSGYWEFVDPRVFLPKISVEAALREIPGAPYTIARLLAHVNWWQRLRIEIANGAEFPTDFTPQVDDWPDVRQEDWDALVAEFIAGIGEIIALAGDPELMRRKVFDEWSAGTMFASHAAHNAYHLGQIALLLKIQGEWSSSPASD